MCDTARPPRDSNYASVYEPQLISGFNLGLIILVPHAKLELHICALCLFWIKWLERCEEYFVLKFLLGNWFCVRLQHTQICVSTSRSEAHRCVTETSIFLTPEHQYVGPCCFHYLKCIKNVSMAEFSRFHMSITRVNSAKFKSKIPSALKLHGCCASAMINVAYGCNSIGSSYQWNSLYVVSA